MNRSYSHSFRPYGTKTKKGMSHNSTISSGLRTVWKYRDTHSLCNKKKSNVCLKKQTTSQIDQQLNNKIYQTGAQQEMKEFIKMMKKSSNEGQQITKPSIQQSRNIQSSKSSRSIHSVARSRCDSRLGTQFLQNNGQLSLDDLEKKIQQLIQVRLSKKSQTRTFFNCKVFEDDLDKQLNKLIKLVRGYQTRRFSQANQQGAIQNQIKQINQKINIIQTAIADSVTESQILKKFYSNKKKVRKQYAVLDNSNKINKLSMIDHKNQTFTSPKNQNPFIHFQTTNMTTFTKPSRNSYTKQDLKNNSYIINRQPLPRSNYQRQFLYYGIVPTYTCQKNKQNTMSLSMQMNKNFNIIQNKSTTYQVQFKEKKSNIIDSKTLDCRQDKLKNLKISFMPSKIIGWKNQPITASAIKKKNKKLYKQQKILSQTQFNNKQNEQKSINHTNDKKSMDNIYYKQKQNQLSHFKYTKNMKTQHQSKFLGQKCTIQNFMKQRNLANLKYSYKFQYQA